jgi:hypothetical protein
MSFHQKRDFSEGRMALIPAGTPLSCYRCSVCLARFMTPIEMLATAAK